MPPTGGCGSGASGDTAVYGGGGAAGGRLGGVVSECAGAARAKTAAAATRDCQRTRPMLERRRADLEVRNAAIVTIPMHMRRPGRYQDRRSVTSRGNAGPRNIRS